MLYVIIATIFFIAGVVALTAMVTAMITKAEKEERRMTIFEYKKVLRTKLSINCPAIALITVVICCFNLVGSERNTAYYAYSKRAVVAQRALDWHEPKLTPDILAVEAKTKRLYAKAVQNKK